jgi:hypothetical protein
MVTAVRGDVDILRPKAEPEKAAIKTEIFEGDMIKTGKRGRVQICFEDDSIVSIGRNATLVVTKYLFDPSAKKGAMKIQVKEGFFRVLGGAVTRIAPENFETIAGTASIGIRGCSFGGQVVNGVATLVFFGSNVGGGIDVTGAGVRRPIGTPGDGVTVPRGGPPSMPSPMERFGVRVLHETQANGLLGGAPGGSGTPGPGSGIPGIPVDPTKALDEFLPSILPSSDVFHGFIIGEELETGWLYRNGSAELLSLEMSTSGNLLTGVDQGLMTVSLHTGADFGFSRDDNFLLPILTFGIVDGEMTDGYDLFGDLVVAVAESSFEPAPENKSYMNWGKWSATFVDPNAVERYARTVNGLWLATDLEQTDLGTLRSQTGDLILGGDFQGSYRGEAHCIRNGTVGMDGDSVFSVDFRSQTFTGQFDFSGADGPEMGFAGRVNSDGSVQGSCTSVTGESVHTNESKIEGALFDDAKVIGTSWNAKTDTNSYIGVAAGQGSIQPTTATEVSPTVGK